MITKLLARDYRSLGRPAEVELGRFVCLVGINGAGKSNILDALGLMSRLATGGLIAATEQWDRLLGAPRAGGETPGRFSLMVDVERGEGRGYWEVALSCGSSLGIEWEAAEWTPSEAGATTINFERGTMGWVGEPPPALQGAAGGELLLPAYANANDVHMDALRRELRDIAIYDLKPHVMRERQDLRIVPRFMDAAGRDWATCLRDRVDALGKGEIIAALERIAGDIDDLRIERQSKSSTVLAPEFHHARSETGPRFWLDASQESDGTLRAVGMLTALLQQPRPALVAVEEPELHLHPGAIPVVFDFPKQASRESQVIVTTQSPDLVDLFDVEDLRVVERTESGTRVARVDVDQREAVKQHLLGSGAVMRAEGLHPEHGA